MPDDLKVEYERHRAASAAQFAQAAIWRQRWSMALLAAIVLTVWFIARVVHWNESLLPAGAAAFCAIVAGVLMGRARHREAVAARRVAFYDKGLARLTGEATQTGHTGEAFTEAGHLYERDLNILGPDSLFGLLATTRTSLGQKALAAMLLHPADAEVAGQRQAAVRELAPLTRLREQIGLLGRFPFEDLRVDGFETWLNSPDNGFPRWPRPVLAALTAAWVGLLLFGLVHHATTPLLLRNVAMLLAVQAAICSRFRLRVLAELDAAKTLFAETVMLREGLQALRQASFGSARLVALQRELDGNEQALAKLQRHLILVEQRSKEWYYVLALVVCAGTHAAFGLEEWRRRYEAPLRRWLAAWAEFETLIVVATYAAEHEQNVFPELMEADATGAAIFVAEALVHPLLRRSEAVANDVALGGDVQFLLISGSNMAGKSTLLRAIGTNAVLALLGAPVPARSLRLSALRVGASIVVGDSLADGKSKFLAEVERLKGLVQLAREHRGGMLFLIDEVLSGTNSLDRKAAAESVLRSLVQAGASGAISTHDLTLATVAEIAELHGRNVHMASPDEDDPLAFDYLLNAGINQTTNAMAIVRMLGLD